MINQQVKDLIIFSLKNHSKITLPKVDFFVCNPENAIQSFLKHPGSFDKRIPGCYYNIYYIVCDYIVHFVKSVFCEQLSAARHSYDCKMQILSRLLDLKKLKKVSITSSLFVIQVQFYNLSMDKLSKDQLQLNKAQKNKSEFSKL